MPLVSAAASPPATESIMVNMTKPPVKAAKRGTRSTTTIASASQGRKAVS
jgi:hypothetical protein